jgi:hypothetical protein
MAETYYFQAPQKSIFYADFKLHDYITMKLEQKCGQNMLLL